tara:strand:- start:400 stop:627 length:228 start_codon:yes stop_codon:yes gene_type:complete
MDNIINYTSEIISKNIDLKNETELELFLEKLKIILLKNIDPDFIYESEESEDFIELPEKNIKYNIDNEGFYSLKD